MKWVYDNGQYIQVEDNDPRPELTPKQEGLRSLAEDYALAQNNMKELIEKLEDRKYIPSSEPEIEDVKKDVHDLVWFNAQLVTNGDVYNKLLKAPDDITQERVNEITGLTMDFVDLTDNPKFLGTFGIKDASQPMKGQLANQKAYLNVSIDQVSNHIAQEVEANDITIEKMSTQKTISIVNTDGIQLLHNPVNDKGEVTLVEVIERSKDSNKPTKEDIIQAQIDSIREQLKKHVQAYDKNHNKSNLDNIQTDCAKIEFLREQKQKANQLTEHEMSMIKSGKIAGDDRYLERLNSKDLRSGLTHTLDANADLDQRLSRLQVLSHSYFGRKDTVIEQVEASYGRYSDAKKGLMLDIAEIEKLQYGTSNIEVLKRIEIQVTEMLAAKDVLSTLRQNGNNMTYAEIARYSKLSESYNRVEKTELCEILAGGLNNKGNLEERIDKLKIFASFELDNLPSDKNNILQSIDKQYAPIKQEKERVRQEQEKLAQQEKDRVTKEQEKLAQQEKDRIAREKEATLQKQKAKDKWREDAAKTMNDLATRLHETDFIFSRDSKEYKNLSKSIDELNKMLQDKALMSNSNQLSNAMQKMEGVFKAANRYADTHAPIEKKSARQKLRGNVTKSIQEKAAVLLQEGLKISSDQPTADYQELTSNAHKQLADTLVTGMLNYMRERSYDPKATQKYTSPRTAEHLMNTEGFHSLCDSMSTKEILDYIKKPKDAAKKMYTLLQTEKSFCKKFPKYGKDAKNREESLSTLVELDADIKDYKAQLQGYIADEKAKNVLHEVFSPDQSTITVAARETFLKQVEHLIQSQELIKNSPTMLSDDLINAHRDIQHDKKVTAPKNIKEFVLNNYNEQSMTELLKAPDLENRIFKDFTIFSNKKELEQVVKSHYDKHLSNFKASVENDFLNTSGEKYINHMATSSALKMPSNEEKDQAKAFIQKLGNDGLKELIKEDQPGKKLFQKTKEPTPVTAKETSEIKTETKTEAKKSTGPVFGK